MRKREAVVHYRSPGSARAACGRDAQGENHSRYEWPEPSDMQKMSRSHEQ